MQNGRMQMSKALRRVLEMPSKASEAQRDRMYLSLPVAELGKGIPDVSKEVCACVCVCGRCWRSESNVVFQLWCCARRRTEVSTTAPAPLLQHGRCKSDCIAQ